MNKLDQESHNDLSVKNILQNTTTLRPINKHAKSIEMSFDDFIDIKNDISSYPNLEEIIVHPSYIQEDAKLSKSDMYPHKITFFEDGSYNYVPDDKVKTLEFLFSDLDKVKGKFPNLEEFIVHGDKIDQNRLEREFPEVERKTYIGSSRDGERWLFRGYTHGMKYGQLELESSANYINWKNMFITDYSDPEVINFTFNAYPDFKDANYLLPKVILDTFHYVATDKYSDADIEKYGLYPPTSDEQDDDEFSFNRNLKNVFNDGDLTVNEVRQFAKDQLPPVHLTLRINDPSLFNSHTWDVLTTKVDKLIIVPLLKSKLGDYTPQMNNFISSYILTKKSITTILVDPDLTLPIPPRNEITTYKSTQLERDIISVSWHKWFDVLTEKGVRLDDLKSRSKYGGITLADLLYSRNGKIIDKRMMNLVLANNLLDMQYTSKLYYYDPPHNELALDQLNEIIDNYPGYLKQIDTLYPTLL